MWTRATGRTTPPCGSSTAGGCGGERTSFHSTVGICSTVCAKGPSQLPTKLQPAEYFRCLSRRRRERHQEYVCGTRTSFHSVVGAYSTVCAKGPTHTPTKVRPAKSFRCLSPPKAGRGTKSTSAGREPASIRQ
ncbi:uncharacterized protein LOC144088402 isoform X2 [Stigmatopora argus]